MLRRSIALAVILFAPGAVACSSDPGDAGSDLYGRCSRTDDCRRLDNYCEYVTVPSEGTAGNFCTYPCLEDLDCESSGGFPAVCTLVGDISYCFQTCTVDTDCSEHNACAEIALTGGGVEYICVPDN